MAKAASPAGRRRVLVIAFVAMACVTLFFAARFTYSVIYWSNPAHQYQPIEGWMTIGYIANSHHVPRDRLVEALDLEAQRGSRKSVEQIAREKGVAFPAFKAEIEARVAALRKDVAVP